MSHTTPHSDEAKRKMSLAKKGKHYPKMSAARRGHKMPLVTRLAILKANIGHHRGGWTCSAQVNATKASRGINNGMWKGGITKDKVYRSWLHNKRNRLKRTSQGTHTFSEWQHLKTQYGSICPACHKSEPEITLTEDHIIPLSLGGTDYINNIQPLCRSCNSKKHASIIIY